MIDLHSPLTREDYSVSAMFETGLPVNRREQVRTAAVERLVIRASADLETRLDIFSQTEASCCFVRFTPGRARNIRITLSGSHDLSTCPSGGWLLLPSGGNDDAYWLPQPPRLRRLDEHGHVLEERAVELTGISVSRTELALQVKIPHDWALDWIVWRLPSGTPSQVEELCSGFPIETQKYFFWGSHKPYQRPADVYLHLIHGHVYENRVAGRSTGKSAPKTMHMLYNTVLSGLERPAASSYTACSRINWWYPFWSVKAGMAAGATGNGPIAWSRTTGYIAAPCTC